MSKYSFSDYVSGLLSDEKWLICQNNYNNKLNHRYETIFTLANGYMGVRGTLEDGADDKYAGTYIAGIFDKSDAKVKELVNIQNSLGVRFYIEGKRLKLEECNIMGFNRILDMKKGILYKNILLKDSYGRITRIEGYRFLSHNNLHRSAIRLFITPINYYSDASLENIINGNIVNSSGVKHLRLIENSSFKNGGCYLEMATNDDDIRIGTSSYVEIHGIDSNNGIIKNRKYNPLGEISSECLDINVFNNMTIEVDKFIVTYTSRDVHKNDLKNIIEKDLYDFANEGIDNELIKHTKEYEELWDVANVDIEGDNDADKALRFNIFQLMSSVNKNDPMVSIAARALHGEGYKGHVFWDTEIFMLPFFIYEYPKAAKTLLMYRYNMLDAARQNAKINGYKGAQYPWESADNGTEETPKWGIDYKGNPMRILTGEIEYHITADVAFAVYEYFRATDDIDFMINYGMEIIIEAARFWTSICKYNKKLDRYEINDVIGPDEFHEHVNNNAYTNYLAKWNIKKAIELIHIMKKEYTLKYEKLSNKIDLSEKELEKWQEVLSKIYIPFYKEKNLIEQFEGYFQKKDYIIDKFDKNNMPLWPDDVDVTKLNDTQLVKQADVLMLLLLLENEFDEETKKANYEYYQKRTMHKSSLGPGMYSIMGLKVGDCNNAYNSFLRSAKVDLIDNQGNTKEGFHAASAGGTWQVAIFGFGGVSIDENEILNINPWLPNIWNKLTYRLYWKGNLLQISITKYDVDIKVIERNGKNLIVKVNGKPALLK